MSGHGEQNPGRGGQNPRPAPRGPYPRPALRGPYPHAHGAWANFRPSRLPPPNARLGYLEYAALVGPYHGAWAYSRPSRPRPPIAAALRELEAASHQYAPAPASNQYPHAPQFGPPGLPPFARLQPPPHAELVNPALPFRPPGPHQEGPFDPQNHPLVDSLQLQPSASPPPRPSAPPAPAAPSPPPLPSSMPLHPSSPGKRHLEDEHHSVPKRARSVTLEMKYMSVLDFLDEHPVTEPYKFQVGSSFGDISQPDDHTQATYLGATVLDGYVEFFFKLHADNKSFGGNFDVSDMLVSEDPLHVTIYKRAKIKASKLNIHKDLMKLISSLVKTRYGEVGNRPAYVDDFISRVEDLSPESNGEEEAWEIQLWVIRNHPLLIEPAMRRLLLQDFYKFYRILDHTAAEQLSKMIIKFCRPRWHVLTTPKDKFISAIYRKSHLRDSTADLDLHEESPHRYRFSGEDGYIAMFLHNIIVRGPEAALACGVELAELELIVAHYFGKLLPTFLEEMSTVTDKHQMLKEILTIYAERRSVSCRALG